MILLRERSREKTDLGKWKSGAASLESSSIVLMLFQRTERCPRFGSAARCLSADIDVMLLPSRFRLVIELPSGQDIVVSWLADALRSVSAGNFDATAEIYGLH